MIGGCDDDTDHLPLALDVSRPKRHASGWSERETRKETVCGDFGLLDLDVATVKSIKVLPLNHAQSLERHD